jgi:hypothetical protein
MWQNMSVDEYANLEIETGNTILKTEDIWWRQIRSFFYRPLLPYELYDHKYIKKVFNKLSLFQHAVPEGYPYNSFIRIIIFDRLQEYALTKLKSENRRKILKAQSNGVIISRITDLNKFVEKGFSVYLSFFKRTEYEYKKDRIVKEKFIQWGEHLFSHPKVVVLGSYIKEQLISIHISCLVNNVLMIESTINSNTALKLHTPDLVYHYYRENAAQLSDIKMIYCGTYAKKESINAFKIKRGAKVLSIPAYINMHPVILWSLKKINNTSFNHVIGEE